MTKYPLNRLIILFFCYLRTKLFYPQARLIRFPFDIRGKKEIELGKGFTSGFYCRFETVGEKSGSPKLIIGEKVQVNDYVHITAMKEIVIGKGVLIASKVYISDCSHGSYSGDKFDSSPEIPPNERPLFAKKVLIEDNVWIGEFVSILPGVTIGKGTIVGANSVVSRSLPPYVIAVGSPAKAIKKYNFVTKKWEKITN